MDCIAYPRENKEQQNRNLNAIRPPIPQNRQRDQRNPPNPPIRPPFQENYVEHVGEDQVEDEIHQLDIESLPTFLTKEEHNKACLKRGVISAGETYDFKRGYQIVVMEVQR